MSLQTAKDYLGLSWFDLWRAVYALGSDVTALELEAYVLGVLPPDDLTWNQVAHALNEAAVERGVGRLITYRRADPGEVDPG